MSTTSDLEIAVKYSMEGANNMLFRIRTSSFMQRGANLKYLSAFPGESEFLLPPLTYFQCIGVHDKLETPGKGKSQYRLIDVVPMN